MTINFKKVTCIFQIKTHWDPKDKSIEDYGPKASWYFTLAINQYIDLFGNETIRQKELERGNSSCPSSLYKAFLTIK